MQRGGGQARAYLVVRGQPGGVWEAVGPTGAVSPEMLLDNGNKWGLVQRWLLVAAAHFLAF